jgi:hypothetical protein
MTPVGMCHKTSITRGSDTPGGRAKHFFNRRMSRGPMPVRVCADAKSGFKKAGRIVEKGSRLLDFAAATEGRGNKHRRVR